MVDFQVPNDTHQLRAVLVFRVRVALKHTTHIVHARVPTHTHKVTLVALESQCSGDADGNIDLESH